MLIKPPVFITCFFRLPGLKRKCNHTDYTQNHPAWARGKGSGTATAADDGAGQETEEGEAGL